VIGLSAGVLIGPGCRCSPDAPPDGRGEAASVSAPVASASAEPREDAEVRPVYPLLTGPPEPLAEKLCDAIHGIPSRRRSECCGGEAPDLGAECRRNVTGALRFKAVELDPAAIEGCVAAFTEELAGCDWITPHGASVQLPAACRGLVKGLLETGARCRSSLECKGALRCHGVGPTTPGLCGPARDRGACGASVDVLATYVKEDDADERHPECKEACNRRRCEPYAKVGQECAFHALCGPGNHCEKGKCAPGERARAGEDCSSMLCTRGLRCVKGTCAPPRKGGDPCEADEECRGTCVRADGATTGSCDKKCTAPLRIPAGSGSGGRKPLLLRERETVKKKK
jgi:hypothetical protein